MNCSYKQQIGVEHNKFIIGLYFIYIKEFSKFAYSILYLLFTILYIAAKQIFKDLC